MQLINELVIVLVNYHLFLFTGYVDINQQALVGNSAIFVVTGTIGMNFLVIFSSLAKEMIVRAKLKYAQRAQRTKNRVIQEKAKIGESHSTTTVQLIDGQNGVDTEMRHIRDTSNPHSRPNIVQSGSNLKLSHSRTRFAQQFSQES